MFRTLSPGDSISAPRRQEGKSGYIQVCNKGSRQSEHQRSDIKLRNLAFYVYAKMQASGLTEFNSFICISAIWGQSCSLVHLKEWQMAASCILPAPQQSPWGVAASRYHSFGSLHLHLETRNHWWLWHFLFIDMAANIFISQTSGKKLILCVISWDVTSPVFNLFLGTKLGCGFQSGSLLVGEIEYSFPYPA